MPIFNEEGTLPLSRFDISPDYEQSPLRRLLLGVAGYKANGTSTGWGRWLDVTGGGIARNLAARQFSSGDTKKNIKDDFSSSLSGLQLGVGIGQTALGMVGPGAAGAESVADATAGSTPEAGSLASSPKLSDGSFNPSAILDGAGASATSTGSAGASSSQVDKSAVATSAGSLGKKTKNNFSMNGIQNIIGGITGLAQGANTDLTADDRKHVYMKYMKCGGKLKMEEGGMLYEKDSKKEDVDMYDKKTGQKVAEMRYGERIFSQRASVVMEELAELGDEEALGKFVAHEIREQERVCEECGMQERACECDEETKMKKFMPASQNEAMLGMKLKKMSVGGNLMKLKRFRLGGKLGDPEDDDLRARMKNLHGMMNAEYRKRVANALESMTKDEIFKAFGKSIDSNYFKERDMNDKQLRSHIVSMLEADNKTGKGNGDAVAMISAYADRVVNPKALPIREFLKTEEPSYTKAPIVDENTEELLSIATGTKYEPAGPTTKAPTYDADREAAVRYAEDPASVNAINMLSSKLGRGELGKPDNTELYLSIQALSPKEREAMFGSSDADTAAIVAGKKHNIDMPRLRADFPEKDREADKLLKDGSFPGITKESVAGVSEQDGLGNVVTNGSTSGYGDASPAPAAKYLRTTEEVLAGPEPKSKAEKINRAIELNVPVAMIERVGGGAVDGLSDKLFKSIYGTSDRKSVKATLDELQYKLSQSNGGNGQDNSPVVDPKKSAAPQIALAKSSFGNTPFNKRLVELTGKMDDKAIKDLASKVYSMSDSELQKTFGSTNKSEIAKKLGSPKVETLETSNMPDDPNSIDPPSNFDPFPKKIYAAADGVTETAVKASLLANPPKEDPIVTKAKEVDKADTPIAATDILNDSYNVFGALISGIQGSKGLPSWQVPGAFQENLNKLKQRSEMGLTDVEKSYATDMIGKNYDRDIANIAATAGGGGSSGATLAASRAASEAAQNAGTKLALANVQAMDSGRAAYTSELTKSVNLDRTQFEDQYTADAARQKAASETLVANMKAITDRGDYNKTYGPGSKYSELQDAILRSTNANTMAMMEKRDEERRNRKPVAGNPTFTERDQKTFATGTNG